MAWLHINLCVRAHTPMSCYPIAGLVTQRAPSELNLARCIFWTVYTFLFSWPSSNGCAHCATNPCLKALEETHQVMSVPSVRVHQEISGTCWVSAWSELSAFWLLQWTNEQSCFHSHLVSGTFLCEQWKSRSYRGGNRCMIWDITNLETNCGPILNFHKYVETYCRRM